jgi:hydrogenase maturation protease
VRWYKSISPDRERDEGLMAQVLIAGIGNIFLGDDGFGVEVVQRLGREPPLGDEIELADVGIAGLHLAYRLLDGVDLLIAVDAISRGAAPGTLFVLEPDEAEIEPDAPDAHSINLRSVLATARAMGGGPSRVLVVGCEPAAVEEGIGLSAEVTAAVEPAMRRVRQLAQGAAKP